MSLLRVVAQPQAFGDQVVRPLLPETMSTSTSIPSYISRSSVSTDVSGLVACRDFSLLLDPYRAAFGIADLRQALVERAQTTLRHVVGARTVQSVVVERETIALEIDSILSEVCDKWGVSIEGILIKYDIYIRGVLRFIDCNVPSVQGHHIFYRGCCVAVVRRSTEAYW